MKMSRNMMLSFVFHKYVDAVSILILGEIYNTVLSIYNHGDDKPLPQSDEVLLCTPTTTLDVVRNCNFNYFI